jgi:hypothetical protein
MKRVRLMCPHCRTPYQVAVEANALAARCPFCGQNNPLPRSVQALSGFCPLCNLTIDDHGFVGDQVAPCPTASV